MKSEFFLVVLLAASAAGGGYWFGQRHAHPVAPVPANLHFATATVAKAPTALPTLPVIPVNRDTNGSSSVGGKLSLAEIEAKILELKKKGPMGYGYDGE
jgi:hypothetical protein